LTLLLSCCNICSSNTLTGINTDKGYTEDRHKDKEREAQLWSREDWRGGRRETKLNIPPHTLPENNR